MICIYEHVKMNAVLSEISQFLIAKERKIEIEMKSRFPDWFSSWPHTMQSSYYSTFVIMHGHTQRQYS